MSGRPVILKPPAEDPQRHRIRWTDELGVKRQRVVRGTQREARAERDRIVAKLERGLKTNASRLTMGELLREWWDDYATSPHIAKSTRERMYLPAVKNWIRPRLGKALVAQLDRKTMDGFVSWMGKQGAQPPTIRAVMTTLSSVMQRAVEWDYVATNPCRGVRRPTEVVEERDAYEPAEVYAMARCMHLDRDKALVVFAAFSGLRQSELFGLKWKNIDWDAGEFRVFRSKSQKWWRVPLFEPAREALGVWRGLAPKGSDLVFSSSTGTRLLGSTWGRRHWAPGLALAGLLSCADCGEPVPAEQAVADRIAVTTHRAGERVAAYDRKAAEVERLRAAGKKARMHGPRPLEPWVCPCGFRPSRPGDPQFDGPEFHELRYTFGSLAALATGDLMQVAEWMGHSDTKMLSRRYKKQLARGREQAVRQVNELLREWR